MGWLPESPTDAENARQRAAPGGFATPEDAPGPKLFDNFAKGTAMLGMQGFASAARGVNLLGGAFPAAFGTADETDAYFAKMVTPLTDVVNYWTPDARTTGAATNVVGGLAKMAAEATAGGAPGLIMSEQTNTGLDLVDRGVDATTAGKVSLAVGTSNALFLRLGIIGKTLPQRVASGAGGNLGASITGLTTESAILRDAGFEEQAKRYDAWDPQGRAIDVLFGAAFGAVTHLGAPRATLAERDAVQTAANANRVQTTSAPVQPATAAGQAAHVAAFDDAVAAVARGEKVDVAATLDPKDFALDTPNPQLATVAATARSGAILANLSGPRATVRDAAVAAGVDPQLTLAIAQIESNFDVNARNPTSSAAGIGQFLDSTWKALGGTAANRFDEATQARLLAELTVKNTDALRPILGREPQPHEVYLAHLLGEAGAKKFLRADPGALVADVSGKKVAEQNGMAGMTVAQATEKWRAKIENAGAEPVAPRQQPIEAAPLRSPVPDPASAVAAVPDAAPTAAAAKPIEGINADFETARQTAEANPSLLLTLDDGSVVPARDAIAAMDREIADAGFFAQSFEIAANCALRGGF